MQGLALDRIVWPAADARLDRVLNALRALATMSLKAHDSPRSTAASPEPTSNANGGDSGSAMKPHQPPAAPQPAMRPRRRAAVGTHVHTTATPIMAGMRTSRAPRRAP